MFNNRPQCGSDLRDCGSRLTRLFLPRFNEFGPALRAADPFRGSRGVGISCFRNQQRPETGLSHARAMPALLELGLGADVDRGHGRISRGSGTLAFDPDSASFGTDQLPQRDRAPVDQARLQSGGVPRGAARQGGAQALAAGVRARARLYRDRQGSEGPSGRAFCPEESLLLLKPTLAVAHGGGKKLEAGSAAYSLLRRWLEQGAPGPSPDDPPVVGLKSCPAIAGSSRGRNSGSRPGPLQRRLDPRRYRPRRSTTA